MTINKLIKKEQIKKAIQDFLEINYKLECPNLNNNFNFNNNNNKNFNLSVVKIL